MAARFAEWSPLSGDAHLLILKFNQTLTLQAKLESALRAARVDLLASRNEQGHWTGELSASALSTATAIAALQLALGGSKEPDHLISRGLRWLTDHANPDGGWGDTVLSTSNISTTTLCRAAFAIVPGATQLYRTTVARADHWLERRAGGTGPDVLASAIIARYGDDRTFSVPILTMCALAGVLGEDREAWAKVIPLPFELAVCPPEWFAALRLPVVSYALPALIAMGIAHHRHRPSANPIARWIRQAAEPRSMRVLSRIQPANGGFLEATPLTSFVVMSLAASGYRDHPVTAKGADFLTASVRPDGSWPIDTNLATWVSTLAVNALGGEWCTSAQAAEKNGIRDWLMGQQLRVVHPYTNAAPGGWAWTDLPGGVPDADDTSGVLLALRLIGSRDHAAVEVAWAGLEWLASLQNRDGGIPTFCRGWGKLPFDQSSPDITAHAIRAWRAWLPDLAAQRAARISGALHRAEKFLADGQVTTGPGAGGWKPLWFGNEHEPDEANWIYGTSRVLLALADGGPGSDSQRLEAAASLLLRCQLPDGSWGGGPVGKTSSVEETALAVEALAALSAGHSMNTGNSRDSVVAAAQRGAAWLADRVRDGSWRNPAPIGFYFAKLWYFERFYPMVMTVSALRHAVALGGGPKPGQR